MICLAPSTAACELWPWIKPSLVRSTRLSGSVKLRCTLGSGSFEGGRGTGPEFLRFSALRFSSAARSASAFAAAERALCRRRDVRAACGEKDASSEAQPRAEAVARYLNLPVTTFLKVAARRLQRSLGRRSRKGPVTAGGRNRATSGRSDEPTGLVSRLRSMRYMRC